MGASVSSIHGFNKALGEEARVRQWQVIGDSTFMHSGMTGLANIAYNQSNSNGYHPGQLHYRNDRSSAESKPRIQHQGRSAGKIDLESLCRAMGFERVVVVDPYDLEECDRC